MNSRVFQQFIGILMLGLLASLPLSAKAQPSIAVLDFELRDLTLLPGVPAELERTASVKPMLERELKNAGYGIIAIPTTAQNAATSGFGYLFDHHDVAAQLGKAYGADYVLVGRLHKPSYLFVYLMAHFVDVEKESLIADYLSEVKGSHQKLTGKGVESLTEKIKATLGDVTR
jgi:Protein of unknown function (DUF2380)